MNVIKVLLLGCIISGCSIQVKDYDAEQLEYEQVQKISKRQSDPFYTQETPPYVKLIETDEVVVEAIKLKPIFGRDGIKLDVWTINARNKTNELKCVKINWKLQDFYFESELPYEFLMKNEETLKVGKMTQTIWSFDDVAIALPPSGYIDSMDVREAEFDKKTRSYTCEITDEHIDEPK